MMISSSKQNLASMLFLKAEMVMKKKKKCLLSIMELNYMNYDAAILELRENA